MRKRMHAFRFFVNKICRICLYYIDTPKTSRIYLSLLYERVFGKKPDLDKPVSFNEKIQWMKLNDHEFKYHIFADKIAVKKYISKKLNSNILIRTYGVYNSYDDINFDELPDSFVLKCSHDSGSVVICEDKRQLNHEKTKKKLNRALKRNQYLQGREWAYKGIRPKIICEELLRDEDGELPKDYKVYCFNGNPKYIAVFYNRFHRGGAEHVEGVYDTEWTKQEFSFDWNWGIADFTENRPEKLEEMLKYARCLSRGMMQSRIDFYLVNNRVYFGEITLYTAGGFSGTVPDDMDEKLGKMIRTQTYE